MILETLKANRNVIILSIIVSLGGFIYGFDTGLISGIVEMKYFIIDFTTKNLPNNPPPSYNYTIESWLNSLLVGLATLGMFSGAISSGTLGDKFGRKGGINIATIIFSIGVLIQLLSFSKVYILIIGRIIAGAGIGSLSGLIPVHQAECAPKNIRGALISMYQLAITIGLLLSNVANDLTRDLEGRRSYNIPIGVQLVFSFLFFCGMYFVPESPRYLYITGNEHKATESILYIHNTKTVTKEIQEELSEISYDISRGISEKNVTYWDLFRGENIRRVTAAAFVQLFQQFTGINFIFYFGVSFFKLAGLKSPFLGTIIASLVNVLSTLPGIYLVDSLGRRFILIAGAVVMLTSQLLIGIFGSLTSDQDSTVYGIPILIASCIFVAAFACSWGIGAWVVCSEVFSQATRSKGNSIAVATNCITNSAVSFMVPPLIKADGANLGAKIGFLWATFILISIAFVYYYIPETKNLSLETINRLFKEKVPAKDYNTWTHARAAQEAINEESLKRTADAFQLDVPVTSNKDS